jgi:hypothetical protein
MGGSDLPQKKAQAEAYFHQKQKKASEGAGATQEYPGDILAYSTDLSRHFLDTCKCFVRSGLEEAAIVTLFWFCCACGGRAQV